MSTTGDLGRPPSETRYHPGPDQLALVSTIEESILALLPLARLHASREENDETWSHLDEIGIFGITAREEQGGSGLGAVEEALIVMTLGQQLAAPAVMATMGAAQLRAAAPGLRGRRIAAGFRRADRRPRAGHCWAPGLGSITSLTH